MKIVLVIGLVSFSMISMDQDQSVIDKTLERLKEEKIKKYAVKVDAKFKELQKLAADQRIAEGLQKRPLSKLYTKEKYAPLLEVFLKEKRIDADFNWQVDFCRMLMPCAAHYNLLGVALQQKAVANARLLVEHGTDVNRACSDLNRSYFRIMRPLPGAVRLNDFDLVKAILAKKPTMTNSTQSVADFPLSIALQTVCSSQGKERDSAWKITQALVKAGCDYLERSKYRDEQSVTITDGKDTYKFIPEDPLGIVSTYNFYFNNSLAYVETFLTGIEEPVGSRAFYVRKVDTKKQHS